MKVQNMTSANGNKVANQFIMTGLETDYCNGEAVERETEIFQSYESVIAKRRYICDQWFVTLDADAWDYSVTTSKYRNQFLNETKKETQAKIDSGEYLLADLN